MRVSASIQTQSETIGVWLCALTVWCVNDDMALRFMNHKMFIQYIASPVAYTMCVEVYDTDIRHRYTKKECTTEPNMNY